MSPALYPEKAAGCCHAHLCCFASAVCAAAASDSCTEQCEARLDTALSAHTGNFSGQYRTKIVRQMRRQIFHQMKQKAE